MEALETCVQPPQVPPPPPDPMENKENQAPNNDVEMNDISSKVPIAIDAKKKSHRPPLTAVVSTPTPRKKQLTLFNFPSNKKSSIKDLLKKEKCNGMEQKDNDVQMTDRSKPSAVVTPVPISQPVVEPVTESQSQSHSHSVSIIPTSVESQEMKTDSPTQTETNKETETPPVTDDVSMTDASVPSKPKKTASTVKKKPKKVRERIPMPEKWVHQNTKYVEKVAHAFAQFSQPFDRRRLETHENSISEMAVFEKNLKEAIENSHEKKVFPMEPYVPLIAKLVQESDGGLSPLTQSVRGILLSRIGSDSQLQGKAKQLVTELSVRECILKSAERKSYGKRSHSKSWDSLEEVPSSSDVSHARIFVWEARDSLHIPDDLRKELKNLCTQRGAVSRNIRQFDTFIHKFNTYSNKTCIPEDKEKHLQVMEKQLQSIHDKIVQYEIKLQQQMEKKQQALQKKEEQMRRKQLEKERKEKEREEKRLKEMERREQEKQRKEAERQKKELEKQKREEELQRKRKEAEEMERKKQEKLNRRKQFMHSFFQKKAVDADNDVVMSNGLPSVTPSRSPSNARHSSTSSKSSPNQHWLSFKPNPKAVYAPVCRGREISDDIPKEKLFESDLSVEELRFEHKQRFNECKELPRPSALTRVSVPVKESSVLLATMMSKMDVDMDTEMKDAKTLNQSFRRLTCKVRCFEEDNRPHWFGPDPRRPLHLNGRNPFKRYTDVEIHYDSEDSGVEWWSEGEDLFGSEEEEDEEEEDGDLEGFLVDKDDEEFGDRELFMRLQMRNQSRKGDYPYENWDRHRGDLNDAPIVIEIPHYSALENAIEAKDLKYRGLLLECAWFEGGEDEVEHCPEKDNFPISFEEEMKLMEAAKLEEKQKAKEEKEKLKEQKRKEKELKKKEKEEEKKEKKKKKKDKKSKKKKKKHKHKHKDKDKKKKKKKKKDKSAKSQDKGQSNGDIVMTDTQSANAHKDEDGDVTISDPSSDHVTSNSSKSVTTDTDPTSSVQQESSTDGKKTDESASDDSDSDSESESVGNGEEKEEEKPQRSIMAFFPLRKPDKGNVPLPSSNSVNSTTSISMTPNISKLHLNGSTLRTGSNRKRSRTEMEQELGETSDIPVKKRRIVPTFLPIEKEAPSMPTTSGLPLSSNVPPPPWTLGLAPTPNYEETTDKTVKKIEVIQPSAKSPAVQDVEMKETN